MFLKYEAFEFWMSVEVGIRVGGALIKEAVVSRVVTTPHFGDNKKTTSNHRVVLHCLTFYFRFILKSIPSPTSL